MQALPQSSTPFFLFLLSVRRPLIINEESQTSQVETSRIDLTIDHNDPLFLHPTDTLGITLIAIQLTGTENYILWSRFYETGIRVVAQATTRTSGS